MLFSLCFHYKWKSSSSWTLICKMICQWSWIINMQITLCPHLTNSTDLLRSRFFYQSCRNRCLYLAASSTKLLSFPVHHNILHLCQGLLLTSLLHKTQHLWNVWSIGSLYSISHLSCGYFLLFVYLTNTFLHIYAVRRWMVSIGWVLVMVLSSVHFTEVLWHVQSCSRENVHIIKHNHRGAILYNIMIKYNYIFLHIMCCKYNILSYAHTNCHSFI